MSRRTVTLITCDALARLKVECDAELIGPADDEFELGKLVEREGWTSQTVTQLTPCGPEQHEHEQFLCPKHELKRQLDGAA